MKTKYYVEKRFLYNNSCLIEVKNVLFVGHRGFGGPYRDINTINL